MRHLWITVASLLLFVACGRSGSVSGPDEDEYRHPNEITIIDNTKCYAGFHELGEIRVIIQEEVKLFECGDGSGRHCPGKGWAWPDSDYVTYWGPWVRNEYPSDPATEFSLNMVASHEVCHIKTGFNETRAELCALDAYIRSDCNE